MENHLDNICDKLRGVLTIEETIFMENLKIDLLNLHEYFETLEQESIRLNKIYIKLPERLKKSIIQFKNWY